MHSKATHTRHLIPTWAVPSYGLLALVFLLLGMSQDAFAQDRVLQEYQALEAAAEEAKEQGIMNRAVDSFRQFEQANRRGIQEALRRETPYNVQATGGPDNFGYTYIDSNEPGGPVYSFISATAGIAAKTNGVLVAIGDDVSSINSGIFGPVALGTAPFNFYGVDYSDAVPATNGYIALGDNADGGPDLSNDCPLPATPSIPGGTPGARIYPLHDDLVADAGISPTGGVYHEYFGTCPHPHSSDGCDVFQWNDANHFGAAGTFDFEAILFENGDIIYQYGAGNTELGSGSTEGIQNAVNVATPDGLTYNCNVFGSLSDNLAVLFRYPDLSTADLAVTKTVNDNAPEVGDNVVFTITLSHLAGGSPNVRVNDLLPDGLTYVSNTRTQGAYNAGNGDWQVGTVGFGGTATLTITASVDVPGTITNAAFVAFSSLPDPDPSNNRGEATVNPVAADLELAKRVIDFENNNGVITATFLVEVGNDGPEDTCGVEVTDYLSPDMTLVSASASQGTVVVFSPNIVWGVGCLDVDDEASMTVTVQVPADGDLINTAEVTAADLPDTDSVPGDGTGDDHALATAGPRTPPDFVPEAGPGGIVSRGDRFVADLKVDKTVDVTEAAIGTPVHYRVDVTNQGPHSTAKVVVADHLPECLTDATWTVDRGTYDGWEWDLGSIKVGKVASLEVWATVGPNCVGTITNTAEVIASSLPDPDDQFNLFDDPPVEDEVSSASFEATASAALGKNYPNPFNPETVMPFSLPQASQVSIRVYDLLGRTVATLVDGPMPAGTHEVRFDGSNLSTGLYLVRMEAAGQIFTQRITLMK